MLDTGKVGFLLKFDLLKEELGLMIFCRSSNIYFQRYIKNIRNSFHSYWLLKVIKRILLKRKSDTFLNCRENY